MMSYTELSHYVTLHINCLIMNNSINMLVEKESQYTIILLSGKKGYKYQKSKLYVLLLCKFEQRINTISISYISLSCYNNVTQKLSFLKYL